MATVDVVLVGVAGFVIGGLFARAIAYLLRDLRKARECDEDERRRIALIGRDDGEYTRSRHELF